MNPEPSPSKFSPPGFSPILVDGERSLFALREDARGYGQITWSQLRSLMASKTEGEIDRPNVDPIAIGEFAPEHFDADLPLISTLPMVILVRAGGFACYSPKHQVSVLLSFEQLRVLAALAPSSLAVYSGARSVRAVIKDILTKREALGISPHVTEGDLLDFLARAHRGGFVTSLPADLEEKSLGSRIIGGYRTYFRKVTKEIATETPTQRHNPDGSSRVPVVGFFHPFQDPPLALGLVMAHAKHELSQQTLARYDFKSLKYLTTPQWLRYMQRHGAGVFLFSDYMWSIDELLPLSRELKTEHPSSIIIHGGPSVPKYGTDIAAFMESNPCIDICVHGEGEQALVDILEALSNQSPQWPERRDLSVLQEIPGITVRENNAGSPNYTTTAPRERTQSIDVFPSPYLTGEFGSFAGGAARMATLETNRGCPYGCTFCDWGSATLQRVRLFDFERVVAELDWMADNKIEFLWIADANFGMFKRDEEIAEKIGSLRLEKGYPKEVFFSLAKNTTKHLEKILSTFEEAGILGRRTMSLQTTDEVTLKNIKRHNIRLDKYDELAGFLRSRQLPLNTDIMMGNPGCTVESVKTDLQMCIDMGVTATVFRVQLLPNAPMNDPEYRAKYKIVTDDSGWVLSTYSYTPEENKKMVDLARAFLVFETRAVAKYLIRYIEDLTGKRAVDIIEAILLAAVAKPGTYPLTSFLLQYHEEHPVPPFGWVPYYQELKKLLIDEIGLNWSAGLETLLKAQLALMPDTSRTFPDTVELDHDVVEYFRLRFESSAASISERLGRENAQLPDLETLGPRSLTITDPEGVCRMSRLYIYTEFHELDSDLGRFMATPATISAGSRGW